MTIPKIGYTMVNGKCIVDKHMANEIQLMAKDYLNGMSLNEKAKDLTGRKIEYEPGKYIWNKNRVRRVLTDERYLGTDECSQILDREIFEKIKNIMKLKNTQKECNRNEIFSPSVIPMICGKCGEPISRIYNKRLKKPVKYICSNKKCKISYHVSDNELRTMVKNILINTEEQIQYPTEIISALTKLNNEIERDFQNTITDSELLKSKIFEYTSLQYEALRIKQKKSMDLKDVDPCSQLFIRELQKRVSAVILDKNVTVRLYFADSPKGCE